MEANRHQKACVEESKGQQPVAILAQAPYNEFRMRRSFRFEIITTFRLVISLW